MSLLLDDKVRFNDGTQKGVGVIVEIDRKTGGADAYLVKSKDIKRGHNGHALEPELGRKDLTNNGWWFMDADVERVK